MNRFALMQACPELPIRLAYAASTALAMLASFKTTNGSEPPSSKHPFFACFAHRTATFLPPSVLPVNLHALTLLSARIFSHYCSDTNTFWYSPFPNPASAMASWIARAHRGVEGECFNMIELPMIMGGMTDLKGSQNGKFHGIITDKRNKKLRLFQ